jgi:hypothetical protein
MHDSKDLSDFISAFYFLEVRKAVKNGLIAIDPNSELLELVKQVIQERVQAVVNPTYIYSTVSLHKLV